MKKNRSTKKKRRVPKTILRLPDLDHAKAAVLNSLTCPDAQRGYRHAIDEFIDWYCSEPRLSFNKTVVLRYRIHLESRNLAPGTINLRLGSVRRLAYEAADCGLLSPDLAAGIRRVKGMKNLGVRLGNWMTSEQSQTLWQAPDPECVTGVDACQLVTGFLENTSRLVPRSDACRLFTPMTISRQPLPPHGQVRTHALRPVPQHVRISDIAPGSQSCSERSM